MARTATPLFAPGAAVALALTGVPAPTSAQPQAAQAVRAGTFDVLLRPIRSGTEVDAIAVRSVIREGQVTGGRLSLSAPIVYAGVTGISDRVQDLVVTDRNGIVPLAVENDTPVPGGFPFYRHWRAERDVVLPLIITYRSLVEPISNRRGPPFGIRPTMGGVSGAGSGFLVLPENIATAVSRVRWDLGDLEPGSIASSSFGDGDFELRAPAAELRQGWYLAGPAGRYPATGPNRGFSATWLGVPPWDPAATMGQASRVYDYLKTFFRNPNPPPYRVFARILDTPPFGGGTALTNSFMLSRGPAQPGESTEGPQGLLFHEMIHGFVGFVEGPQGVTSWFSEGLTSYYTTNLQLRGGFGSVADYGEEINEVARDYYTNAARNWSAARIVEIGFSDNDIRHLPYRRGQLYFADLDSKIRAASGGRRNLDIVMREIFARRATGWRFDHAAWAEIVTREAGPQAAQEFQAVIIDGTATLVPASDAFGPCFARQPTTYTIGDRSVEGYRWERVAGVPDNRCLPR